MKGRKQNSQSVPPPTSPSTPFFARFLEDQRGDAGVKAAASFQTLKYPSDRDEIEDVYSPINAQAAPTEAAPSRMTLKYPSDRDEIEPYVAPYGNAAGAP
jgi:hypothetical protein